EPGADPRPAWEAAGPELPREVREKRCPIRLAQRARRDHGAALTRRDARHEVDESIPLRLVVLLAREEILPVTVHAVLLEQHAAGLPWIELLVGEELHVRPRPRREPELALPHARPRLLTEGEVERCLGAGGERDCLCVGAESRLPDRHLVLAGEEIRRAVAPGARVQHE